MQTHGKAKENPVRWGILSAANIGVKRVAPAIHNASNGKITAVASRNPQRARDLFAFAPDARIYGNYESLIKDPEIEAMYIPLPNSLHAEWAIKALNAGKHVLCEKPLATTAEQGANIMQAALSNRVLLMEAFMYRFHPQTIWTLEQVKADKIGKVKLVKASFAFDVRKRPHDIRLQSNLAGGSLMDVGCYPVNFCRAVFGRMPVTTTARVSASGAGEVERAMNAILDFEDGCFGLIDSSFELPARQVGEIIGEKGSITVPMPFTPGVVETEARMTIGDQTIVQHFSAIDPYQLEVEHFANCVRKGEQPELDLVETIENLATIESIYRSAGHRWPLS
ncbi:MAG TPA: Gfo/Idh/MocA family oxidoreductase [Ktedonobacteraceae bacterium]|nr:Gfo/Idh/MocA family oxidoreductase [Ktedonobacteraceae bacterium]